MNSCMVMCVMLGMCLGMASASRTLSSSSSASASLSVWGGGSGTVKSKCSASDGWTADCHAEGTASDGGHIQATSVGDARQGNVNVESYAVALESSDVVVIAKAVADGAGDALAIAIADGVKAGGDKRAKVVAAIAKVVAEKGCPAVEPALAVAFAKANQGGYLRTFADAFDMTEDVDIGIAVARCLYPKCIDDRWHCCNDSSDYRCGNEGFSTFKTTPHTIYGCPKCQVSYCMCY